VPPSHEDDGTLSRMKRRREAGFTLIEVMVTVAIIAILAAIAVPSFFREARKAKGSAEVQPIFNDLRSRMEQYHQENGVYPATIGEGTLHPLTQTAQKQTLLPLPATWTALRVRITGNDMVYCGYTWVSGLPNDNSNVGPQGTAFAFTPPATNWYYLLAHCNLDGNPAVDGYYFSSSVDPTFRSVNDGS
jgi:prepilin-type N-terminal cleavage/methylation domain-containing protein